MTVHGCKQLVHNYRFIQISDSVANNNQTSSEVETFMLHNNPSIVSHDTYTVMPSFFWWEAEIIILNLWGRNVLSQPHQRHVKDAIIIKDFS